MARPPKITARDVSDLLKSGGPASASDLAARLRVDRSTITRTIGNLGPDGVSLGATRRTRYALRRKVRDSTSSWPIFRIDETGRATDWGRLEALHGGWRFVWSATAPEWAAVFTDREGFSPTLPFFLRDLRPDGPQGSGTVRALMRAARLPEETAAWIDDDILIFLSMAGQDLPGNLVVGDECLRAALALQLTAAPESTLAPHQAMTRYPELAARAAGDPMIGGAQPAFFATLEESGTERRPVLVKFSPMMSQAPGRRWADLLAMEFHALAILTESGLAESGLRLVDAGGRRFLEATRFDRTTRGGRRGLVSLKALHGAVTGGRTTDWTSGVLDLERAGLVDAATARDTRRLQAFGELIGNTGMNADNLAFRMTDQLPFTLAPAFDMLPMLWAPGPQGELLEPAFAPQPPLPAAEEAWREMLDLARGFWSRVIADQRVSREFASSARAAGEVLTRLAERFG